MSDAEREARERLVSAGPSAVETLVALLESEDEATCARAALGILGKVWPTGVRLEVSAPEGAASAPVSVSAQADAAVALLRRLSEAAKGP